MAYALLLGVLIIIFTRRAAYCDQLYVKPNATITIGCLNDGGNHSVIYNWTLPYTSTAQEENRLHFKEDGRLIVQNATEESDSGLYVCFVNSLSLADHKVTIVYFYENATCPVRRHDLLDLINTNLNYVSSPDGNRLYVQFPFYGTDNDLLQVEWFDSQNRSIATNPDYNSTVERVGHQERRYTVTFGKATANNGSFTLRVAMYDPVCEINMAVTPTERMAPRMYMAAAEAVSVGQNVSIIVQVDTYPGPSAVVCQWSVCSPPGDGDEDKTWPMVERCVRTPTAMSVRMERVHRNTEFATVTFRPQGAGILECTATDDLGRAASTSRILYMKNETIAPAVVIDMGEITLAIGSPMLLTVRLSRKTNTALVQWLLSGRPTGVGNDVSQREHSVSEDLMDGSNLRVVSLVNAQINRFEFGVYEAEVLRWDGGFTVYRWTVNRM